MVKIGDRAEVEQLSGLRKTAVLKLAGHQPFVPSQSARLLELMSGTQEEEECTYLLVDTAATVDAILDEARHSGRLLDVSATVIGL